MAQTKKKRHTKHRGNAAGIVEARGRTSRPPSPEVAKAKAKEQVRAERMLKAPTWQASLKKSAVMAPIIFVALLFLHHSSGDDVASAFIFALLAFALYVPGGYYLELYMWRRRMKDATATGVKRGK